MPDDTHMDLRERVAALEQMLVARTAERDAALQQETATRFTHPPPRCLDGQVQCAQTPVSANRLFADAAALVGRPP